jgi:3-methyladenine DNA glycosylase AlkD
MIAQDVLDEPKAVGKPSIKKVLMNHGAREPFYGVSVEDLKKIQKRIKKDYQLALDLYDTGIYDAMYLAGLIADDAKMTKRDLQRWIDTTKHTPLCGSAVAWVAAGSPHGREMALKWIDSKKEYVATAGWSTLVSLVAIARGEGQGGGSGEVDAQARSRGRIRDGRSDGPRLRRDERNCQRGAPPLRGGIFGVFARERGWARS